MAAAAVAAEADAEGEAPTFRSLQAARVVSLLIPTSGNYIAHTNRGL